MDSKVYSHGHLSLFQTGINSSVDAHNLVKIRTIKSKIPNPYLCWKWSFMVQVLSVPIDTLCLIKETRVNCEKEKWIHVDL